MRTWYAEVAHPHMKGWITSVRRFSMLGFASKKAQKKNTKNGDLKMI